MDCRSGAQVILDIFKSMGIGHVFSLPGTSLLGIYDALAQDRDIDLVVVRHEENAAFMAHGYGWATGIPGVCITTRSPGSSNTVIAVQNAHQASAPLVAIVGGVAGGAKEREALGETDLVALFRPITKWSVEIEAPERLPEILARAFWIARSGRPGPVMVSIPMEVQMASVKANLRRFHPLSKPRPSEKEILQAAELLSAAERPVILAGGGVLASGASAELLRVAELLQAPVIATWMHNDVVPNSSPYFLGGMGPAISSITGTVLQEADIVLAIGCRFSESTTNGYTLPASSSKIIQMDIEPSQIARVMDVEMGIVCDAREGLLTLEQVLSSDQGNSEIKVSRRDSVAQWRRRFVDSIAQETSNSQSTGVLSNRMSALEASAELRKVLPANTVYTLDGGAFTFWITRYVSFEQPKTLIGPSGSGAMGFGLPTAIGIALANPGKPVVNIAGDGSFLMTMQELDTAVRLKLPVVNIIWNNDSYGSIRAKQVNLFGGRTFGVDLPSPDFASIARAFGASAESVDSVDQIRAAVERALVQDRPSVIDLHVDRTIIPPGTLKRFEEGLPSS